MKRIATGALFFAAGWLVATYQPPCTSPLTYRIGRVDPGFGLTRSDVLAALERAEGVWESTARPALFGHDEGGEIVVNFVYDNRQKVAQENAFRKGRIDRIRERTSRLKRRHERASELYRNEKNSYARKESAYSARLAAHNRNVDSWNARGGAPPIQYEAIRNERAALEGIAATIESARNRVNALADRANRLSDRHNALAGRINGNVEAINTTAGREFKQGLFTSDMKGMRIDVFEYTSMDDLVHVLAHELGHALGIGHNENPDAIMYGLNSSRSTVLAPEDLAQLAEVCGI